MKEPDATATAVTMTAPMKSSTNDTPLTWSVWLGGVDVESAHCSGYLYQWCLTDHPRSCMIIITEQMVCACVFDYLTTKYFHFYIKSSATEISNQKLRVDNNSRCKNAKNANTISSYSYTSAIQVISHYNGNTIPSQPCSLRHSSSPRVPYRK